MKVQRIEYPSGVHECKIPSHKPLYRVFDKMYEINIPFHTPFSKGLSKGFWKFTVRIKRGILYVALS